MVHDRGTMAENSKKYNENDVEEAVKAVNEGRMSLRESEQPLMFQNLQLVGEAKVD